LRRKEKKREIPLTSPKTQGQPRSAKRVGGRKTISNRGERGEYAFIPQKERIAYVPLGGRNTPTTPLRRGKKKRKRKTITTPPLAGGGGKARPI